jgi:hypothetical protein
VRTFIHSFIHSFTDSFIYSLGHQLVGLVEGGQVVLVHIAQVAKLVLLGTLVEGGFLCLGKGLPHFSHQFVDLIVGQVVQLGVSACEEKNDRFEVKEEIKRARKSGYYCVSYLISVFFTVANANGKEVEPTHIPLGTFASLPSLLRWLRSGHLFPRLLRLLLLRLLLRLLLLLLRKVG